jgi:hypothetical protein
MYENEKNKGVKRSLELDKNRREMLRKSIKMGKEEKEVGKEDGRRGSNGSK